MDLDFVEKTAKEILINTGTHSPQMIVILPNNSVEMYVLAFEDDSKKIMRDMMRKRITDLHISKYFIIMETWLSELKDGIPTGVMPRDDPNRVEALVISEYNRDMTLKTSINKFDRDGDTIKFREKMQVDNSSDTYRSQWNFFVEETTDEEENKFMQKTAFESTIKKFIKTLSADDKQDMIDIIRQASDGVDMKEIEKLVDARFGDKIKAMGFTKK